MVTDLFYYFTSPSPKILGINLFGGKSVGSGVGLSLKPWLRLN